MNNKPNYILPIILVTSLFFLWGLAYGLLDVLNKHFQETLNITKQRSTLLQAAYFGAYFLIALPVILLLVAFFVYKGINGYLFTLSNGLTENEIRVYNFITGNPRPSGNPASFKSWLVLAGSK